MTKTHEIYLQRAIDIAQLGKGNASPNPIVGAVVVHESRIIGEGWHEKYGAPHAEVNAIAAVQDKELLPFSTLYVTLEPCFHVGKTPPCVDLVLKHKIPRVIIGCADPNPLTTGKSIAKMRVAGVEVIENMLQNECEQLIRTFRVNILQQRPYIQLKWAQSTDGFIGKRDQQIQISNDITKRLTHKWRSEADAILVGTNTVATDNPLLNNRLYIGKSPIRIVLDKTGRLSSSLAVFDGKQKTIVITENKANIAPSKKYSIVAIPFDKDFLKHLLKELYRQKIGILMVEGGAKLLSTFIKANIWDEAQVFLGEDALNKGITAPKILQKPAHKTRLLDNEWMSYLNLKQ
jgi:diaminohydroxyphosphoribosylaminopyrimidine deaminase / 5-amino-6-(5-phosphoribosylamino)uracil reductase